jgi:hypothetical protein
MTIGIMFFWDVSLCGFVKTYQHLGGNYCLYLWDSCIQGGDNIFFQNVDIYIYLCSYVASHPEERVLILNNHWPV